MVTDDKLFIGGCKEGNFHLKENNQVDVKLFVTGDDIATITKYAKEGGKGTFKNNEGKTVVPLRIRTSQSGKLYCEIDTWVPDKAKQEAAPAANDSDDLPF